jgi:hypothetical protein
MGIFHYVQAMYTIKQTLEFKAWLADIGDGLTRRRLAHVLCPAR